MAADGSGQRDDCYDVGDAMDILQGLRFHMPGQQWQMLDDMVAGETACKYCTWTRNLLQQSNPVTELAGLENGAAEKRKSVARTGCV